MQLPGTPPLSSPDVLLRPAAVYACWATSVRLLVLALPIDMRLPMLCLLVSLYGVAVDLMLCGAGRHQCRKGCRPLRPAPVPKYAEPAQAQPLRTNNDTSSSFQKARCRLAHRGVHGDVGDLLVTTQQEGHAQALVGSRFLWHADLHQLR